MARCLQAYVRGSADKGTDDCERAVRDPKLGALRRDVGNQEGLMRRWGGTRPQR